MNLEYLLQIVGIYLTISGLFDAYKYHWQANAIKKIKTARGQSRKFINAAIHNDLVKIVYLSLSAYILKRIDWYLLSSSIIALIFMLECWWTIYLYYPYRYRGLSHFKRPNIFIYIINSLLSNKIRKRL